MLLRQESGGAGGNLALSGNVDTREACAKGGHARAAKLTAKQRSDSARKAAREVGEGQEAQTEVGTLSRRELKWMNFPTSLIR